MQWHSSQHNIFNNYTHTTTYTKAQYKKAQVGNDQGAIRMKFPLQKPIFILIMTYVQKHIHI